MAINCDKCGNELQRSHLNDLEQATVKIGGVAVVTGDWCRRCVDRIKQEIIRAVECDARPAPRAEKGQ